MIHLRPCFIHHEISSKNQENVKFTTVKVIPKKQQETKIDYSQSYTANNFITTVRAFNEYLLKPTYVLF